MKMSISTTETILECVSFCHGQKQIVSAIKGGTDCYCMDHLPEKNLQHTEELCDVQCPGDQTTFCGGNEAYDFYVSGLSTRAIINISLVSQVVRMAGLNSVKVATLD